MTIPNLRGRVQSFGVGRSLVVLLIVVLVAWLAFSRWQLGRERRAHEDASLRASNAIAERDVSRKAVLSAADAVKILGDSLQAVERLGVQRSGGGVKSDAFDRATDRTTVVRGGISVTPGSISTTTVAVARDSSTVTFHVDSSVAHLGPRYVADAVVTIPPRPALPTLRLGVTFSPIVLEPRIQCGPAVDGIRPATMAVLGPAGVPLEVRPLELNVRVCNEDFGRPTGIRVPLSTAGLLTAGGLALGFVAGVLVAGH